MFNTSSKNHAQLVSANEISTSEQSSFAIFLISSCVRVFIEFFSINERSECGLLLSYVVIYFSRTSNGLVKTPEVSYKNLSSIFLMALFTALLNVFLHF
jgi:hypothetical protein